jgi:two-component system, chemotaxis family, chemotaxis protein CheY
MHRCLVIDDSPVIRRVARRIIEDFGFEVSEAEHGRQAFEQCIVQMPDVILLDWQLPVMGAYEFMRALKSYGPKSWPYIIYCTTEFDFLEVQRSRAAGASDYLMKPFDRGTLTPKFAKYSAIFAAQSTGADLVREPQTT